MDSANGGIRRTDHSAQQTPIRSATSWNCSRHPIASSSSGHVPTWSNGEHPVSARLLYSIGMANGGTGIPFPEHSRPRPGALLHAYRMDVGLRQGTRMTTLSPSTRPETACTELSSQTSSNSRGSSPSKVYNGPPAKSMTSSPSVNTADFGSGDFGASFLP